MSAAQHRRIAFLTASCMQPDHPDQREDRFEHDLEVAALQAGCTPHGIQLIEQIWDAPDLDPNAFDGFMVGTTWDYMMRPDAFMATLDRLATAAPVFNAPALIRWNAHKSYLRDLADAGAAVVPTLWQDPVPEDGWPATIQAAFDALDVDELVVKPTVGAGAWRQAKLRRGDPIPAADQLPPHDAMIQPYLPAAATEGERSLLLFNRQFSHALQKVPKAGDYRVQAMYGATEHPVEPSPDELQLAQDVLDAAQSHVPGPILYARVDIMRGLDGKMALMELELIEPYLYPEQGPQLGPTFGQALNALL